MTGAVLVAGLITNIAAIKVGLANVTPQCLSFSGKVEALLGSLFCLLFHSREKVSLRRFIGFVNFAGAAAGDHNRQTIRGSA